MSGMGDGYVGTSQDAVKIRRLQKQREAERQKIQEQKTKTATEKAEPGLLKFGSSNGEVLDTAFTKEIVGLATREEYIAKRLNIRSKYEDDEKERLEKLKQEEAELQLQKRKKRKIKGKSLLSFVDDIVEDEEDNSKSSEVKTYRRKGLGKDPNVDTTFLPDADREEAEKVEREKLKRKWYEMENQVRLELLQITYSYWDGTGHRRVVKVKKGDRIADFLKAVQQQLAPEFREIKTTSVDNLLYVKEDVIIPHQYTFYELIVNKARGKSGPLFHFDVHEDVRTVGDATVEKDESHAGKIVLRQWYYKNKHIFPASRWEIYDPAKNWVRYSIHGD